MNKSLQSPVGSIQIQSPPQLSPGRPLYNTASMHERDHVVGRGGCYKILGRMGNVSWVDLFVSLVSGKADVRDRDVTFEGHLQEVMSIECRFTSCMSFMCHSPTHTQPSTY